MIKRICDKFVRFTRMLECYSLKKASYFISNFGRKGSLVIGVMLVFKEKARPCGRGSLFVADLVAFPLIPSSCCGSQYAKPCDLGGMERSLGSKGRL